MPAIEFDHACVDVDAYDEDRPDAVQRILGPLNTTLTERRIGIIGANGSGKSTMARLINGLAECTEGRVLIDGTDVAAHGKDIRRRVGFVFSDADSQIIMPNVRDDIAFSLRRMKMSKAERDAAVDKVLWDFGLAAHAGDSPHTLSGGQKQLLALASVLVMQPELIIADEPTTLLDLRNRLRIAHEFSQLEQQLIVVTHDMDLIRDFDRVLCLDSGAIIHDGTPAEVIDNYVELMRSRPFDSADHP